MYQLIALDMDGTLLSEYPLTEHDYVVTCNGALVQNTKQNHILLDVPLSVAAYKELYELSKKLGVNIHALTEESVLTPVNNPFTEIESKINQIPTIVGAVEDIKEGTLIIKVMFVDEPEVLEKAVANLPQWVKDEYSILRSAPYFLEFLDSLVNKGLGVDAVC